MNKVFITGATGFVGPHIVEFFTKNKVPVTCMVRETSDTSSIADLPVTIVYGDIRDKDRLSALMKGHKCVIHNAAHVSDWGDWQSFEDINISGTCNVLEAAAENRIDHIIMTGSISVYGEENSYTVKDEHSPLNSHYNYFLKALFPCKMNYYRDSKKIALVEAQKLAVQYKINLTAIHPGWIFGEGEYNTIFYETIKLIKETFPVAMYGKNSLFITYAQDIASIMYNVYEKKITGVNNYLVGYSPSIKIKDIIELYCKYVGLKSPVRIPLCIISPVAFIIELIYTLLKIKNPPLLTRGRVKTFYDNLEFSTEKIDKELGFIPQYSVEEAIKRTTDWYKNMGIL
ncbi:MAG TPA: NAD-dependent epimerase/dehydratase family protein [Spirochaetota bacterium]|nr:NAD-dependent epimerase/dehydratase family protein [Spirochaetota bacterium]